MKIGEAFQHAGLIDSKTLNQALQRQQEVPKRLGDILLELGCVTEKQMAPALAEYFQIPFVRIKEEYQNIDQEVLECVSKDLAIQYKILPIARENNTLLIATTDPLNLEAFDLLHIKTGLKINCVLAFEYEILEMIDVCYKGGASINEHIEKFMDKDGAGVVEEDDQLVLKDANDQPIIQYVQSLIIQAVNARASDILIQPKHDMAELRFRIDGVLYDYAPPPKSMVPAVVSRIKILSKLDIAEKRLPQDGRFKIVIGNREVDIRTSSFPTIYGESIVLRILDTAKTLLKLDQLGFSPKDYQRYSEMIRQPYGLILVTGPTGSGKTTTLYATLNEIKSRNKNILTLEDPVEYRLPFIQQTQVNATINFDFARGLRSILRQDPDIIMIGEIRDKETAEIAIHAALTGHLVFSTLHTNDAVGAAVRLINMGVEPFLITSALLGVVGQRLIRSNCTHCKKSYPIDERMNERLNIDENIHSYQKGEGCPHCFNTGYLGRDGIYELFETNESINRLILQQEFSEVIRTEAIKNGMKPMRQIAIERMKQGLTSIEEVLRITQEQKKS